VSNRSVADFEQLCDRLIYCSASELCMLQPVLYMHLDPDRIPEKSTPAATTDIELAQWSLTGIINTFNNCPGTGPNQYLISAWDRVALWLVFFHNQFIMRRASYKPINRRLAVDLVGCMLQCSTAASDGDLATTPALYHLLVELWLIALKIKDEDALIISQHPYHQSPFDPSFASLDMVVPVVLRGCMSDKAFMTTMLEVSGDIDTVVSTALEYVMHIGSMAQDPKKVASLPSPPLDILAHMFWNCVDIIIQISDHSAAVREEFILRQSVRRIFLVCRLIQLQIFSIESTDRTFGKPTLVWSFEYLVALLVHADDTIPVLHQALHSNAFEIVAMSLEGPPVEADFNDHNESFLVTLEYYLVYDKILTYACKHVDAWSNALEPILIQNEAIRKCWSRVKVKTRLFSSLKSREEMIRRPSPDEKGWILRVSNRLSCFVPADKLTRRTVLLW
jgi:hypothetical protein